MIKIGVGVALVALSALIGFVIGRANPGYAPLIKTPSTEESVQTTKSLEAAVNPLFKTQAATFQGKITSIAGKTLQVTSDSGEKGEFDVSDSVVIYKFAGTSTTASASSDIKTIDTGREVLISLELLNGKYQAVTISYFRSP
ncbi:hypothetical protein A3C59_02920 [Candidatus Daviesbacteria bacterium RIFCSPHIGHO2_02_FULL_36_13]|uniref:DUF5666 domain-containing protein n=1 Tax=Candidatus Daviesbacteria bacterium RIFCSPHIGHO2_02_FULL_36_13 TaxID=1797768 RepID=A0A1F5JUS1_9BACT|nr:MAG: hypothetical protein A3C59_02920 [Candidatus Daviesbacteria bacterium RIFCSPHIGHO2_02_FULL_36_13]